MTTQEKSACDKADSLRDTIKMVKILRASRLKKTREPALIPVGRKQVVLDADGVLRSAAEKNA